MSDENKPARILLFEGIEHNKKLIAESNNRLASLKKELKEEKQWTIENREDLLEQIAELKKDIEVLDEAIGGDQMDADNNESKFGLVKEINELKEFDKGSQKWSVLIEEILRDHINAHKYIADQESEIKIMDKWVEHLNTALEKLEAPKEQTVKQPSPFKFCSECGYSGNVRHIVCPECHNSYFKKEKTEKKEVGERECPKCGELYKNHKITSPGVFICKLKASGGSKSLSTPQTSVERRVMGEGKEASNDNEEKLPDSCEECGGYRMGERMMHNDGCSQCTTGTTVEKHPEPTVEPSIDLWEKNTVTVTCPYCRQSYYLAPKLIEERIEGNIKKKLIDEFESLIKRAVRNIRKKYPDNGQLVGLGYVETIFKREFNKLKEEKTIESKKEFEFQLIEKFIPPRGIKCSDCMNNPVPKLIEDFQADLEELIAWANNYPKDSEIYIRLKRKREKWQGMLE